MASIFYKKFGVEIYLSNSELNMLSNSASGSAGVASLVATLQQIGIGGTASTVAAIASALLWIGSASLSFCNSKGRGVVVTVLWVGLPWCRSQ